MSKYRKFSYRLKKSMATGNFWKLSSQKRQELLARIEKLRNKLLAINPKLAGAMVATGFLLTAGNAVSQTFVQQTGTNNPANAVVVDNGYGAPIFADLDNDGDKDMIIGDYYNAIQYYKNTGTASAPVFTQQTGTSNNPFELVSTSLGYTVPTLGDIDGDGDFDLLYGQDADSLSFYKNVGSNSSPIFVAQTGTDNIFPNIGTVSGNYYDELAPSFVDIDGDGDLDVLIGDEDSYGIVMLKNVGTATAPSLTFISQTNTQNPFAALNPLTTGDREEPGFGDIDKDGDIDAWLAGGTTVRYFQNNGTSTSPAFAEVTGTNNPFAAVVQNGYSYAAFVDIDADGDTDFFVGDGTGISFYKNTSVTSVTEYNNINDKVSVFPNPAQNKVSVSIKDEVNANPYVIIMDVRGLEVMKYQALGNDFAIDISNLAAGVYTLKLTSDKKVAVTKIVKE